MQWNKVESSNIAALAHLEGKLFVQFTSGKVYQYANVGSDLFQDLLSAESVGRTFNQLVKSKPEEFPYKQVS